MGFLIIYDEHNRPTEILGDEVGQNQARKFLGQPHYDKGRYRSERELEEIDKLGE